MDWDDRENDRLGGKNVYSGSKGAAELVIKSYWMSFIKDMPNIKLAVTRAGNVSWWRRLGKRQNHLWTA